MEKLAEQQPQKINIPKTMMMSMSFAGVTVAFALLPYLTVMLDRFLGDSAVVADWSARFAGVAWLADFLATQSYGDAGAGANFTIAPLLIGFIVAIIYLMGMIFQPIFGKMSDNWRSRLGKRRPFIFVLMPISAILLFMLPMANSLTSLLIVFVVFSFVMAAYRVPTVSVMPDLTPSELRSNANAIVSLMGGVGTILGMGIGMGIELVYRAVHNIPAESFDEFLIFPHIFAFGAIAMCLCAAAMIFVKEQDSRTLGEELSERNNAADRRAAKAAQKAEDKKLKLDPKARKSLMFMLVGLFFLFMGSNVIQVFFALFAAEILHQSATFAMILMAMFAVCAAAGAVPAGMFGRKFGRRNTMIAGLAIIMVVLVAFFGVFLTSSARNGMTMNQYTTLNHAYVDVQQQTVQYNAPIIAAARAAAEAAGTDFRAEDAPTITTQQFVAQHAEDFTHLPGMVNEVFDADYTEVSDAFARMQTAIHANLRTLNLLIYPVLVIAGLASMMLLVNAMPMVVELGGKKRVGTFTGYYYIATYSAQIVAPISFGFFVLFAGTYMSMFYYIPVMFVVSGLALLFVRHGEASKEELDDGDIPQELPEPEAA
ncbi:MAG: MFS transporter [Oscillospiraceae bacterium]|nr:MFS transporter [Oscillospiraceae bacterium]